MSQLPQETICAIASYLDSHNLRKLSSISRAFVAESQRQLFRTVGFYHHHHFLRWYRTITPAHPIIPSYVRTFVIFFSMGFYNPPTQDEPDCYIMASKIFASFTKLERIFLRNLKLCYPHQLSMVTNFSASAPSIRSLRIEASQCSPGLMAKFIYLFPHLDYLHMEMIGITDNKPYGLPTPSPSFQGHGRLTLASDYCSHLRHLPLCFKHLYLTFYLSGPPGVLDERNISILNDFFVTCAPTLEHLTLCGESLSPSSIIRDSRINLGPEMDLEMETEVTRVVDLSPCKRLRTLRLELRELSKCPPYVTQVLASLESSPSLEIITLAFYSSGRSLIHGLRRFSDEWDAADTQLCRLAELKDGYLRVSMRFNGFRIGQGIPLLTDFGAFMAKFLCPPHSFTILCDSSVVTHRDTELP